jgi:hypothetical protein
VQAVHQPPSDIPIQVADRTDLRDYVIACDPWGRLDGGAATAHEVRIDPGEHIVRRVAPSRHASPGRPEGSTPTYAPDMLSVREVSSFTEPSREGKLAR